MLRSLRQCVFVDLVAIFIAAALAASTGAHDDLSQLVADLGSSDFATRQQATAALAEAGSEAFGPLEVAAASTDAEVRRRALSILLAHSLSGRTDWRALAQGALQRVAQSSSPPSA